LEFVFDLSHDRHTQRKHRIGRASECPAPSGNQGWGSGEIQGHPLIPVRRSASPILNPPTNAGLPGISGWRTGRSRPSSGSNLKSPPEGYRRLAFMMTMLAAGDPRRAGPQAGSGQAATAESPPLSRMKYKKGQAARPLLLVIGPVQSRPIEGRGISTSG
jgi:hypothetical protein